MAGGCNLSNHLVSDGLRRHLLNNGLLLRVFPRKRFSRSLRSFAAQQVQQQVNRRLGGRLWRGDFFLFQGALGRTGPKAQQIV